MKVSSQGTHVARSVERALALLDSVVSHGSITLTEAARAVDVPTPTALRHLRALEVDGYVSRGTDGTYSAGPRFHRLALTALDASPTARLAQIAGPVLDSLEGATEESAYLAVPEGEDHAVYVAIRESRRAVRHVSWLGARIPRQGTAVGLALSGEVSAGSAVHVAGAVEADVVAIASPVTDRSGNAIAAVAVVGPEGRLRGKALDRATAAVIEAAADLGSVEELV